MLHELKFKGVDLCDAVYSGEKKHEIRKNDRDYKIDDIIKPIPIDDSLQSIKHPIADKRYRITWVTTAWSSVLAEGYCVFSIEELTGYIDIITKSRRWKTIAYLDLVDNLEDSLLIRNQVGARFIKEYRKPGAKHKVVFVKVPACQYQYTLDALALLRDKMIICGHEEEYDKALAEFSAMFGKSYSRR